MDVKKLVEQPQNAPKYARENACNNAQENKYKNKQKSLYKWAHNDFRMLKKNK